MITKRSLSKIELKESVNLLVSLNMLLLEEIDAFLYKKQSITGIIAPVQSSYDNLKKDSSKYCPYCGAKFYEQVKFCHACGNGLIIKKRKRQNTPTWVEIKQRVDRALGLSKDKLKSNSSERNGNRYSKLGKYVNESSIIDSYRKRINNLQEKFNINIYK